MRYRKLPGPYGHAFLYRRTYAAAVILVSARISGCRVAYPGRHASAYPVPRLQPPLPPATDIRGNSHDRHRAPSSQEVRMRPCWEKP